MEQKQPTNVCDEETASQKPLKPVLHKPPGFRNQQKPPSETATLTGRRPRPLHPAPVKRRRRSFCRLFCCCVCIVSATILLLLFIVVTGFFIWFNPKLPVVRLASFKINNLNFSGEKTDEGWSSLTADSAAMLQFRNPNGKLVFYYGDADVAAIIGEKDSETNLGSTRVKGFIEKAGDRTAVILLTRARERQVDDPTGKRLGAELKSKKLLVKVIAKTKLGLAVGSRKFIQLGLTLNCGSVRLHTLDSQMAKCTIKMLKWIRLRS